MLKGSILDDRFTEFARSIEPRLRRALIAGYGPDRGREAAADALIYAWRRWDKVGGLDNPGGYLYRVGARIASRRPRPTRYFSPPDPGSEPWFEPGLANALDRLSTRQRTAVVLHHSFEWTHGEIASELGLSVSTVRNHIGRGVEKLRRALEVSRDG